MTRVSGGDVISDSTDRGESVVTGNDEKSVTSR